MEQQNMDASASDNKGCGYTAAVLLGGLAVVVVLSLLLKYFFKL